jgi:galactofuranose transport system permease protein
MNLKLSTLISKNKKFLPLSATILLFMLAYGFGALSYGGMRDAQVFFTLFIITPFLLISAVGETFVVITGGIDLSVSGMIALTATASAALLHAGWNPWLVMGLMLVMGMLMGGIMGGFISYMKVQPFIATLAGMWFARGMCYIISDSEIRIYDPLYKLLAGTKILIPGLSDPSLQKGDYITPLVVLALAVFVIAIFIAHFTRFGRTVYAIGGNNGANEQAARLMGLPVDRTKLFVYVFSGLCSALAGIAYSIYVGSGHGTHATGFEMTVIAAVVIGGTMLTGGEGYVFGTLFGVLTTALIQMLIQFNGKLSSWWTNIAIGVLTLGFIGIQSLLVSLNTKNIRTSGPVGEFKEGALSIEHKRSQRRKTILFASLGVVGVAAVVVALTLMPSIAQKASAGNTDTTAAACTRPPLRVDDAQALIDDGAVITYERNGGMQCVSELYGIYPDGRIVGNNGQDQISSEVDPAVVQSLLESINNLGWFTDDMYSTFHTPCPQCFDYLTTVSYDNQIKSVEAVDGGTDAPAKYWVMSGQIKIIVPQFPTNE